MIRRVRLIWGLLILFFVVGSFFIFSKSAKAETLKIQITEVQYHPNNPSGISSQEKYYEWFELYNPNDIDIDIKGWSVKDNTASNIIPDLTIKSKNYAVVVAKKTTFEENFSGLSINNTELAEEKIGNGLANSADSLTIFDELNNKIDSVNWTSDCGVGKSILKNPETSEITINSSPHPGFLPIIIEYSNNILINEILPAPETSQEEYVELYNGSDGPINLKGWQIDDANDGSSPFTIGDSFIPPNGYLVIYQSESKIYFNNDGDSVRLFDPLGNLKETVIYTETTKGLSYSRFDDLWEWSNILTPLAVNAQSQVIQSLTENGNDLTITKDILDIKKEPLDSEVSISGQVSVPPGVLSEQYFYLEDKSGGIQVYDHNKEFPPINLGDYLTITGNLSETHGEKRIKITNDINVATANNPITPLIIDKPSENLVGCLVKFIGTVTKSSGQYIYLKNDQTEVRVYIISLTNIKKPRLKIGNQIEVVGILSYYDNYFRLLPRFQDDIKILDGLGGGEEDETLPESGSNNKPIFFSIIMVMSIFVLRNRLSRLPVSRAIDFEAK